MDGEATTSLVPMLKNTQQSQSGHTIQDPGGEWISPTFHAVAKLVVRLKRDVVSLVDESAGDATAQEHTLACIGVR